MHYKNIDLADIQPVVDAIMATGKKMILLNGELGAGKTTLLKQWIERHGFDSTVVSSPTYTYMNSYHDSIIHIDMRRIESSDQLHELGVLDAIDNHEFVAIEWPKWTELYADSGRLTITIEKTEDTHRNYLLSS